MKVGLGGTKLGWKAATAQLAEEKMWWLWTAARFSAFLLRSYYQIVIVITVYIKIPKGQLCECILTQGGTPLFSEHI